MPSALSRCTPFHQFNPRWEMTIERICEPLWKRETLTVLHSRDLRPMARDLESRFTEAAIGHIQFSDIRNFGHGRHNWLAKHGDTTGVLALASTADQAIARRTLDLLPVDIPQAMIDFPDGPGEPAVGGVLLSIYLAGVAGEARDIDPGRPGVPSFGRKIYHLRNGTKRPAQEADAAAAAIDRKISSGEKMICCKKQRRFWRDAHRDFCDALTDKKFNGIVFDYDGTLCARRERIDGPSDQVSAALTRLASRSIPIGIATGRGRSVRKALRRRIPREFWPLVTVGYYNGGMIGQLSQNSCPQRSSCSLELSDVEKAINRDSRLRSLAESIETRGGQISVQCASNVSASVLRSITQEIVERCGPPELRVVWSTHSVDILASNVTKVDVVRAICERHELADQAPILKIGDLGQWPGNDYQLLAEADSLSVDQISPARNTCWNLAPPGTSGTDALLSYLGAISPREGGFYFFPERIRRKRRR
ncbi:MAG: HAD family phosphatase [Planctomycetota bacterium]|nr:MAG: HAD family phosphatase [Planctomycetota bacterium]REK25995.1 MAG: HAD family phosphatase [Planctomycetota bacterium]REK46890.1 MAG: HAD family phosphatase [Planctomycetota bacterium]